MFHAGDKGAAVEVDGEMVPVWVEKGLAEPLICPVCPLLAIRRKDTGQRLVLYPGDGELCEVAG